MSGSKSFFTTRLGKKSETLQRPIFPCFVIKKHHHKHVVCGQHLQTRLCRPLHLQNPHAAKMRGERLPRPPRGQQLPGGAGRPSGSWIWSGPRRCPRAASPPAACIARKAPRSSLAQGRATAFSDVLLPAKGRRRGDRRASLRNADAKRKPGGGSRSGPASRTKPGESFVGSPHRVCATERFSNIPPPAAASCRGDHRAPLCPVDSKR